MKWRLEVKSSKEYRKNEECKEVLRYNKYLNREERAFISGEVIEKRYWIDKAWSMRGK